MPVPSKRLALSALLFCAGVTIVVFALKMDSLPRGGREPGADDPVTLDLIEDVARHARVERSTRSIEFGADSARDAVDEPDPRRHADASGFLSFKDEKSGATSAVVVGSAASVRFTHFPRGDAKPLACTLSGVGIDDGKGDQTVVVLLNGAGDDAEVARFALPPGTAPVERRFELPADRLKAGANRLTFRFARTVRRAFPLRGEPFRWPVAAAFQKLSFEVDEAAIAGAGDIEVRSVGGVGGAAAARSVVFEQGARVSFAFALPSVRPHMNLRVFVDPEDRASGREVPVTVRLVAEPVGAVLLSERARFPLDASSEPAARGAIEVDADLSVFAGRVVELQVETGAAARGERPCRVVVAAPLVRSGDVGAAPRPSSAERDALRARLKGMNLVLVTLDAAAARRFTAYGCDHELTPRVAKLAVEGVTWEGIVSPASYTLASIGSLFTGQWPDAHGIVDDMSSAAARRLDSTTPTLASALKSAGYSTLALVTNPNAGAAYGFDAGFATYDELFKDQDLWHEGVEPEALAARLERHIDASALKEPYCLYAHFFQPHAPYDAPARFEKGVVDLGYTGPADGSRGCISDYRLHAKDEWSADDFAHLARLYDANLAHADAGVAVLLDVLEKRGLLDKTIVMVVGDHGEEFGEHGGLEHGDSTFTEQVEVPWILHLPKSAGMKPTRVPGPGSLIDVAPTALALLSVDAPGARFDGIDRTEALVAAPGVVDPHAPPRALFIRSSGVLPRYAVRWRNASYHEDLRTRERLLFHRDVDPGETNSVAFEHPALADAMRALLADFACAARGTGSAPIVAADPEMVKQAAQIGYAAGGSGTAAHGDGCRFLRRTIPAR